MNRINSANPFVARRALIKGSAAAIAASAMGPRSVWAAPEFSYKFASNIPATHPLNMRVKEAADRIRTQSSGRLDIQMFPAAQLGSDTDMLNQLRSGAIEFYTISPLILSILVPSVSISAVGFAFPDTAAVWKAMDGELGAYARGQINKAGLVVMDKMWDNGFRQTTTSVKPIQTPEDLRGLKMRVPVSPLLTSCFKAFGALPAGISFNEVYSALQTKVVDGQENPLVTISISKLYEVQKYCSLTNHIWDGLWFVANRRAWEKLPQDLRDLMASHMNQAAIDQRADIAKVNASAKAELAQKGLMFNDTDPIAFRKALRDAGFYAEWKKKFGDEAWSALEKSVGVLN